MQKEQEKKTDGPGKKRSHPEGNSQETRAKAKDRRQFIAKRIRERGLVKISELEKRYPGLNPQSIRDDVKAFNDLGIRFVKQNDEIVDSDVAHTRAAWLRADLSKKEKDLVADLTASLLIGFPEGYRPSPHSDLKQTYSESQIIDALQGCDPAAISTSQKICVALRRHYLERMRMVAIDDGTTNYRVALRLGELESHSIGNGLCHMTVVTNGRTIFHSLCDKDIYRLRGIAIGGEQVGSGTAVAGPLSEMFLRAAAHLHFGISVVGATSLNLETNQVLSDSNEEALLKRHLFSRSALRVIAIDNSKLNISHDRAGFGFSAIHPDFCDLIITNTPISMEYFEQEGEIAKKRQQTQIDEFPKIIAEIEKRGVAVLSAISDQTIAWKLLTKK